MNNKTRNSVEAHVKRHDPCFRNQCACLRSSTWADWASWSQSSGLSWSLRQPEQIFLRSLWLKTYKSHEENKFNILNMVLNGFDMILTYEIDTRCMRGYDFDMVFLCFDMVWVMLDMNLIWFWYYDMVWERSIFFRVPDGLPSRTQTETAPGQAFGDFLRFFMVLIFLIWFRHGFDTTLIWFCFDLAGWL